MSCRNERCRARCSRDQFYCESCAATLWSRLVRDTSRILDAAAQPYVGRSGALETRQLAQAKSGLPIFSVVHWAYGIKEADHYERSLIREFRGQLLNDSRYRAGDKTGHYHAIYVAWHPQSTASLRGFRLEDAETWTPWPGQFPDFKTVHVLCPLTRAQAGQRLAKVVEGQREYYQRTRNRWAR